MKLSDLLSNLHISLNLKVIDSIVFIKTIWDIGCFLIIINMQYIKAQKNLIKLACNCFELTIISLSICKYEKCEI